MDARSPGVSGNLTDSEVVRQRIEVLARPIAQLRTSYATGRRDKSNSLDLRSCANSCPGRDGSMNVMAS